MLFGKIFKEPLLHFLAAALAVFAVFEFVQPDDAGELSKSITVHQADLLEFLQYRAKAFDPERIEEEYGLLTVRERKQLIEDYVREEALYREAKVLGLDKNDYLQKLRLIRKLEFAVGGLAEAEARPEANDVERYFEAHKSKYAVPAKITFAHVFFSNERHGAEAAERMAKETLKRLNSGKVRFDQATAYGDRFLYGVNYVQKDTAFVAGHFGREMSEALFGSAPGDRQMWRGVFHSLYGAHLVLVTDLRDAHMPALNDIYGRVSADFVRAKRADDTGRAIREIVEKYDVQISDDVLNSNGGPGK